MSFRAAITANTGTSASATLALAVPPSSQVGDYVLIGFVWTGASAVTSIASSTGRVISEVIPASLVSTGSSILYGFAVAAGDAGSVITVTLGSSTRITGIVYVESHATGVLESPLRTVTGTSTTISVPSVTPGGAGRRQISFYGGTDTNSGVTNSFGDLAGTVTPYTTRGFTRTPSPTLKNANLAVADRTLPGTAATSVATSTASASLAYTAGMTVLVVPSNASPTANAGPDQTVAPGATVTLDGTASTDPESGALTYAWTQLSGPAVALSSATATQPTFTTPASVDGATLVFGLVVTDPSGQASAQDTVTITVAPAAYLYRREGGSWVRRKLYRRVAGAWVWP